MTGNAVETRDHQFPSDSPPAQQDTDCPRLCEATVEGRSSRVEAIAQEVFQAASADLLSRDLPGASCRIEIGPNFTLLDVQKTLDYLDELGVKTVYLSPFFQPRPSDPTELCQPAYDNISRRILNPQLGGNKPLKGEHPGGADRASVAMDRLMRGIESRGMTCIFDLVPNHMAFGERAHDNRIAWSVLKYGEESRFKDFFYLNFEGHPEKKIVVPVLGSDLATAVAQGCVRLCFDPKRDGFHINIYGHTRFPVSPASYARILSAGHDNAEAAFLDECIAHSPDLRSKLQGLSPAEMVSVARKKCKPYRLFAEALELCRGLENCTNSNKTGHVSRFDKAAHVYPRKHRGAPLAFEDAQRSTHLIQRVHEIEVRIRSLSKTEVFKGHLSRCLSAFEPTPTSVQPAERLLKLLQAQPYEICCWSYNQQNLNYMRFFEISHLARTNMQVREAFREANGLAARLTAKYRCVAGGRVDHPGGMLYPGMFLHDYQLKVFLSRCRRQFNETGIAVPQTGCGRTLREQRRITWSEVRKEVESRWEAAAQSETGRVLMRLETVLGHGETQPKLLSRGKCWHDGGVGYENRDIITRLGVSSRGALALSRISRSFMGHPVELGGRKGEEAMLRDVKAKAADFVIGVQLHSDFQSLAQLIFDHFVKPEGNSGFPNRWHEYQAEYLRGFLMDLAKHMPVYRTYLDGPTFETQDEQNLKAAFQSVRCERKYPESLVIFMEVLFIANGEDRHFPFAAKPEERRNCVATFQAITGPVMAMAVENTVLYRTFDGGPLGWLDVGTHFQVGAATTEEFHQYAAQQAELFPMTSTPADTHDLKRSSDVSNRLNAITHNPRMIAAFEKFLSRIDRQAGRFSNEQDWQDPTKWRYFIYSHAAALWPLELTPKSTKGVEKLQRRLSDYIWKAINEGKEESSYFDSQWPKECAVRDFVRNLLTDPKCVQTIYEFARKLSPAGARLSLANSTLRHGGLGVPDDRLGSAVFTFRAVDPDNRKAPDLALCRRTLRACRARWNDPEQREVLLAEIRKWPDQHVAKTLFEWRGKVAYGANAEVMRQPHVALKIRDVTHRPTDGTIAWMKRLGDKAVVVVAEMRGRTQHAGKALELPPEFLGARFANQVTGEVVTARLVGKRVQIRVNSALQGLPGAILVMQEPPAKLERDA